MFLKTIKLIDFLSNIQEIAYYWDLKTNATEWLGFEYLFQESSPPVTLNDWHALINPQDLPQHLERFSNYRQNGGVFESDYRIKDPTGQWIWIQERGKIDSLENSSFFIGTIRSIEPYKQCQQHLEQLAYFDNLTGFFTKHRFKQHLTQVLEKKILGIYFVFCINNLDVLNIAYGFEITDKIIHESVNRLRQWLKPSDIIGRISGNCYGIIIEENDYSKMDDIAVALRDVFRSKPFETNVGTIQVTISVGGVLFPEQGQVASDIITKADSALAQAKRHGINSFKAYSISQNQKQQQKEDLLLTTSVHKALLENRLKICYQAAYNPDKSLGFYEALIRMVTVEGKVISAAQFMPVAEQFGMANTLDRWVMETVVKEVLAYPDLRVALNISGYTVNNEEWLNAFKAALKPNPETAKRLIIEITETAAIDNVEKSAAFVNILKAMGCQISLDDFGAGYTSFLHLKCLPLDIVKIDAAYVKDIDHNPQNLNFIKFLLSLTQPRGIKTVAEGIETEEVYQLLKPLNVDYYQGYLLGKPTLEKPWANNS